MKLKRTRVMRECLPPKYWKSSSLPALVCFSTRYCKPQKRRGAGRRPWLVMGDVSAMRPTQKTHPTCTFTRDCPNKTERLRTQTLQAVTRQWAASEAAAGKQNMQTATTSGRRRQAQSADMSYLNTLTSNPKHRLLHPTSSYSILWFCCGQIQRLFPDDALMWQTGSSGFLPEFSHVQHLLNLL